MGAGTVAFVGEGTVAFVGVGTVAFVGAAKVMFSAVVVLCGVPLSSAVTAIVLA